MIHNSTLYHRRYWILLLFRAATFSGLGTISSDLFHRLVYFTNALTPAVGLTSETARVLKASYGPLFPDYQWDLDRLVGLHLISVVDMTWVSTDQRFFGKYKITSQGIQLAEKIASASTYFSDVERAISEIVSAFISNPLALSTLATTLDANLGQDTVREGQIVDFGEWTTENFSTNAAEFLFESWQAHILQGREKKQVASEKRQHVPSAVGSVSNVNVRKADHESYRQLSRELPTGPTWRPLTYSHPKKRSFHLYAHYLVQSLVRNNTFGKGAKV